MLALRLVPLFMPALVLSGMVVIYSSLPLYISALLVLASIASLSYVAWNYESYIQTVKQQKKQIEHLSALQESQLESYHSLEPLFIESLPVWARHIDSANQHLTDSVSELSQQFSQLVERLSHTLSLTGVNSHGKEQSVTEEIHQCRSMLNNAVDALRAGQTLRQQVLSEMRELMKYTTSLKKMAGEVVGIADKTNIQTVKQQKKQIEHLSALQESQLESYHSLEPLFIESLPVWARHIDSANQHLTDSVSELSQQFSQLVERLSHTLSLTGVNSHGKEQSVTEEIHQCRSMLNNAVDALRAGQTLRQQVLSEMRELMKYTTSLKKMAGEVVGIADKTNLLALNAAIESARAGEAGRGFAVVADEVRGLSQQSRETASKMTEQVNSVNAAIEKACEMVEQVNKDETEQMNNTEQCIDEVINHFQHIVQTLDEQAQGLTEDAQQVKETVTHVIIRLQFQDRVSQILEQITRNLTELGDAITLVQQDRNHPIVGQLSPQKWLDKMKSSYTMIEQHQVHTGKKSTHSSKPEVQSDITFF